MNYDKSRENSLRLNYGITLDDYDKLLSEQDNRCYICHIHISELDRALAVDHNHKTGKVRGILCLTCNGALGILGDTLESLERVVEYLKENIDA